MLLFQAHCMTHILTDENGVSTVDKGCQHATLCGKEREHFVSRSTVCVIFLGNGGIKEGVSLLFKNNPKQSSNLSLVAFAEFSRNKNQLKGVTLIV